jgi:hypothetical protein
MTRLIGRFTLAAALAIAATVGLTAASWADCNLTDGRFHFDFASSYPDCFREVQRGGGITPGMDLGLASHTALNITGSAGSGGGTWLTVVDQAPGDSDEDNVYGSEFLCADILIQRFDNTKGAGVVALLNEEVGKKGLALILYNAGNTDRLVLATVEGDPAQAGKLAIVKGPGDKPMSVSLGGLIQENAWYRVLMTVMVDGRPQIMGQVFKHKDGTDPNSLPISQVGGTLVYTPDSLPAGVDTLGQNGIIGSAISAVVNASVTNFSNKLEDCLPPAD